MLTGNVRGSRPGQKSRDDGEQRVGRVLTVHSLVHVSTTVETQTSMRSMGNCCRGRVVVCRSVLPRLGSHCPVAVVLKDRCAVALRLELTTYGIM